MPEHPIEPLFNTVADMRAEFHTYDDDDDVNTYVPPTHVRRRPDGTLTVGSPGSEAEATGWRELDGYDRWILLAADGVLRKYDSEL